MAKQVNEVKTVKILVGRHSKSLKLINCLVNTANKNNDGIEGYVFQNIGKEPIPYQSAIYREQNGFLGYKIINKVANPGDIFILSSFWTNILLMKKEFLCRIANATLAVRTKGVNLGLSDDADESKVKIRLAQIVSKNIKIATLSSYMRLHKGSIHDGKLIPVAIKSKEGIRINPKFKLNFLFLQFNKREEDVLLKR